jgi:predicted ester cyclase/cbb3-type cytochrome oxidase subunit 3
MLNEGDINRSNSYIKKSMDDANFYNARLRNVQISKLLPIIDTAFQKDREQYQKKLQLTIVVIILLSLFLAGIIFYLFRQMKKLAAARREVLQTNNELKKINNRLTETNHIKEAYIGRFLNQCSEYIEKLEAYRKSLNKKAAAHKLEELYEMLKSSQIIENELKAFYQNFDHTFLNLFPDFVERFNELLADEDKVVPKQEESLTVELRIFALIRLGITDSAKIADFLRYSITTIYNYRSKFRKKSIVPNGKFEEKIMKIGESS